MGQHVAKLLRTIIIGLAVCSLDAAHAQTPPERLDNEAAAEITSATSDEPGPDALAQQSDDRATIALSRIFSQISGLKDVDVTVRWGVARLTGTVSNQADREKAVELAQGYDGIIAVENEIERTLEVDSNLSPALNSLTMQARGLIRGIPLFGVAVLSLLVIAGIGHLLARQRRLWEWLTPNGFLAELAAGAVRLVSIIAGLIVGLQILDATALLGLVLGSAGVIGIALGFAVRDTVDNYVSSLMLSLRQPFRANDHIVIDSHEGRVIRLTSRATVLMTLEGNHLRIPNSTVFKAIILNYTRNPQRRFSFDLGVGGNDDPIAAMQVGLDAMRELPFLLNDPRSSAVIVGLGDSTIDLRFHAWIDQTATDLGRARSLAIQAAKCALEAQGFALPEPHYSIRMTNSDPAATQTSPGQSPHLNASPKPAAPTAPPNEDDARPDQTVEGLVNQERAESNGKDLLDNKRPVE